MQRRLSFVCEQNLQRLEDNDRNARNQFVSKCNGRIHKTTLIGMLSNHVGNQTQTADHRDRTASTEYDRDTVQQSVGEICRDTRLDQHTAGDRKHRTKEIGKPMATYAMRLVHQQRRQK